MTDHSIQDDASLMRQIAKGRKEALSELYDRYARLVFSLALHTTGDRASAEEITQDVFVRAWLASIARHRSIDLLRRQGTRAEVHSVSWDEMEEGPGIEVPSGGTQQEAELSMRRADVRAAVANLPEEQKQALALVYFRGYTQAEVATVLRVPLGTVKTRIRLAMDKLRTALQDQN